MARHFHAVIALLAALAPLAQCHMVIIKAQGDVSGSNASIAFGADPAIARNCTLIQPCQLDTTIIRETEINDNTVNLCGRTQLIGNIDIAYHTESALAAGTVTQVKSGSEIQLTLHQVNADGAGPYTCDIDEGSNSSIMEKQLEMITNVPGANGISQAMAVTHNITVKMPANFTCTGASTGNICTVRCRNSAIAGPFGGCFAVQQVDVQPTVNTPTSANVNSYKDGKGIVAQLATNLKNLENSKQAVSKQGLVDQLYNDAHAKAVLQASVGLNQYPTGVVAPAATATLSQSSTTTSSNSNSATGASGGSGTSSGSSNLNLGSLGRRAVAFFA